MSRSASEDWSQYTLISLVLTRLYKSYDFFWACRYLENCTLASEARRLCDLSMETLYSTIFVTLILMSYLMTDLNSLFRSSDRISDRALLRSTTYTLSSLIEDEHQNAYISHFISSRGSTWTRFGFGRRKDQIPKVSSTSMPFSRSHTCIWSTSTLQENHQHVYS